MLFSKQKKATLNWNIEKSQKGLKKKNTPFSVVDYE